jgi:hypothetical protein
MISQQKEKFYTKYFDMKSDLNDLKKLTLELIQNGSSKVQETNQNLIKKIYGSKKT